MAKARVVTSHTIPILCYHKVGPFEQVGRRLNVEPSRFESHVRFFARRGFRTVLARDLPSRFGERAICYSFDDGFECTMQHAVPVLGKYGAVGSFYVVTGKVGALSDWDGGESLPLAGWDVLREAQGFGHEISNHTVNHARLSELNAGEQIREISEAERRLGEEGIRGGSFCYPYGSMLSNPAQDLEKVGLEVGLSLTKGVARSTDPIYALPRVTVAYSHSLPMLLYRLFIRFR